MADLVSCLAENCSPALEILFLHLLDSESLRRCLQVCPVWRRLLLCQLAGSRVCRARLLTRLWAGLGGVGHSNPLTVSGSLPSLGCGPEGGAALGYTDGAVELLSQAGERAGRLPGPGSSLGVSG